MLDLELSAIEELFKSTSAEIMDEGLSAHQSKQPLDPILQTTKNRQESFSEIILAIFMQFPVALKNTVITNKQYFHSKYHDLLNLIEEKGVEAISSQDIDLSVKNTIDQLFISEIQNYNQHQEEDKLTNEINSYVSLLKEEFYKNKINQLHNEIKNAESSSNQELINELLIKLNKICEEMAQINKQ